MRDQDETTSVGLARTVGQLRRLLDGFPDDTVVTHAFIMYAGGDVTADGGIEGKASHCEVVGSLEVAAWKIRPIREGDPERTWLLMREGPDDAVEVQVDRDEPD